ncbi:MAG: Polyphosphate kinase [Haliscomenobacter sp.]|nr:Polyphosphate kinase [Haliscomenobacter sp.]
MANLRFFNRDISWLAFNHRVLQEARDLSVPLYERIKFLAIFSSNLDEFFRVRISALRFFKRLPREQRKALLDFKPKKELREVLDIIHSHQIELGAIFRDQILPELRQYGIFLLTDYRDFAPVQQSFAQTFFNDHLRPLLATSFLQDGESPPFLENRNLYFIVEFTGRQALGLVSIPTTELPRFLVLPAAAPEEHAVTFLDEILRMHLPTLFPYPVHAAYEVKISRDAELYIDDEYSGDLVGKIRNSLSQRALGLPTRLLYDAAMPVELLHRIKAIFGLKKPDLFPGARYHNFHDFMSFPNPDGLASLHDDPMLPLACPPMEEAGSLFELIAKEDQLLHLPYQKFDYLLRFLEEAAADPAVEVIQITMYRVASRSGVVQRLKAACEAGKTVIAFIEAKARFDEASNLEAGQELELAGATVLYSHPGLKVHSKLLLIDRREKGGLRRYAYLSTGNFNEKTARIYADHGLFTADPRLTEEAAGVFELLRDPAQPKLFHHLLVSPYYARARFFDLVQREIDYAMEGKPAFMILKMNSLEDPDMVELLYRASNAGVRIQLIIRGICCLVPGIPGQSEHIEVVSIIDRFLEHARVYWFANGGEEVLYLASADWMTRNLDRRVEVVFPIYHTGHAAELKHLIHLQLRDNAKARIVDDDLSNSYKPSLPGGPVYRAQTDTYAFLQSKS